MSFTFLKPALRIFREQSPYVPVKIFSKCKPELLLFVPILLKSVDNLYLICYNNNIGSGKNISVIIPKFTKEA